LETAWGFSCLVDGLEKTILFDTGGNSSMLLSNMRKLGVDPQKVEIIVISHLHSDHVGGLRGFLEKDHNLNVFLSHVCSTEPQDNRNRSRSQAC